MSKTGKRGGLVALTPGSCKAKGRRLAVRVRDAILERYPTLKTVDVRVTPSGVPGPDIQLSMAAIRRFPFGVEAKNTEHFAFRGAWTQAVRHSHGMRQEFDVPVHPVVFFSRNREEVYAILRLDTLAALRVALPDDKVRLLTSQRTIDFFATEKPFLFPHDIEGYGAYYVDRMASLLSLLPERSPRRA